MNRASAREFSFQYLFHLQLPIFEETKKELTTSQSDLKNSLIEFQSSSDLTLTPDEFSLALRHIATTAQNTESLEQKIIPFLRKWKLERISKVDRTLLLLAVNEMESFKETPTSVVINEAIELAKKYGSQESPSFVNAVLDNILKTSEK